MTTPKERTLALIYAGELLRKLASSVTCPHVPEEIRDEARHILRHYPSTYEVHRIGDQVEGGSVWPLLSSKII